MDPALDAAELPMSSGAGGEPAAGEPRVEDADVGGTNNATGIRVRDLPLTPDKFLS